MDLEKYRFTFRFNGIALLVESAVFYAIFDAPVFSIFATFIHLAIANLIWCAVFKAALFRSVVSAAGKRAWFSILRFQFTLSQRRAEQTEVPEQIQSAMENTESIFHAKVRATARWMFIPSAIVFLMSVFAKHPQFIAASAAMAATGFMGMYLGRRLMIAPVWFDEGE